MSSHPNQSPTGSAINRTIAAVMIAKANPNVTAQQLADSLDVDLRSAQRYRLSLERCGLVEPSAYRARIPLSPLMINEMRKAADLPKVVRHPNVTRPVAKQEDRPRCVCEVASGKPHPSGGCREWMEAGA